MSKSSLFLTNRYSVGLLLSLFLAFIPTASAQNLDEVTVFEVAGNQGEYLIMNGTINSNTPRQFEDVLSANPQIQTIVMLYCPGSSDDEANIPMARKVRARGLNTHVTAQSDIASGCVDFFLAGNVRTMEPGAAIGVHSWFDDDDNMAAIDYPRDSAEHESFSKFTKDMLGSDAFFLVYHSGRARRRHALHDG
jgi:hypothetical protein